MGLLGRIIAWCKEHPILAIIFYLMFFDNNNNDNDD